VRAKLVQAISRNNYLEEKVFIIQKGYKTF